jgi:hypothetical protein
MTLALGHRSVAEMLSTVSSREISEWQAYEAEHGPVWLRPDWGSALVACTLANIHRDSKRHPDPFGMEEFLIGGVPDFEQTPEQMATIFEMTAAIERAREEQQKGMG